MCHETGPNFRVNFPHDPHAWGPMFSKDFHGFIHKMKNHFMDCMAQFGGIPYNLDDQGDSYVITIPLPGRNKDEVKINLINRILNIKADKPKDIKESEKEEKSKASVNNCCGAMGMGRRGFRFIEVDIDIPLPGDANEEDIKSAMSNGVLKIKIGKKSPKNINIENN